MAFHDIYLGGIQTRVGQGCSQRFLLRSAVWHCEARTCTVVDDRCSAHHAYYSPSLCLRIFQPHHRQDSDTFATAVSVSSLRKRLASTVGRQSACLRQQHKRFRARRHLYSTHYRQIAPS